MYCYFPYAAQPNSLFRVGITIIPTAFLGLEAQFFKRLLKLVQSLAQLRKRLSCGIGFLSTFLVGAEIGFLHPVFPILTTVSPIVCSMRAPMLLADVAMLLGASFLGDSGSDSSITTRLLVSFLALVGSFPAGLCVGLLLCTYTLYSLKRHKKQTHVYGSHTFLVKVELVLPRKWHIRRM
jgi:hypothetical protein